MRKTAILIQKLEGITVSRSLWMEDLLDNMRQNLLRPASPLSVFEKREEDWGHGTGNSTFGILFSYQANCKQSISAPLFFTVHCHYLIFIFLLSWMLK